MKQYSVTGMNCAACSARVEKAVRAVPGVTECAVSLLTNSMGVSGSAPEEAILQAVRDAGYGASPKGGSTPKNNADDTETPALKRRLISSLAFLAVLMYISMGHTMWGWPLPSVLADNPVAIGLCQLLLTAAVLVINQKFFVSGFRGLLHRSPNMDTLVALGSAAAFGYSTYALFAMSHAQMLGHTEHAMHYLHEFYFESAAMILTLITVGKMLEARSKGKTTDALRGLMNLAPQTATVIRNGKEVSIPVTDVMRGDTFVVRPGESIPVDGMILEGESAVNESALTGESIPADKSAGDTVSAGTINQSGFLRCEATQVGEDTTLSHIIQMVSDAAATKAPIAKIADTVSGIFVPVVIGIAAVTTVVWLILGESVGFALARGISVLVISCPCALGLATPVAIMVGNGVGAKNGILFKTAAALEATGRTQIAVLDKTGTVTSGEPKVTDILTSDGVSEEDLLTAAAALEAKSEHPLARAILEEAKKRGILFQDVSEFSVLPGRGLTAALEGDILWGGSAAFIGEKVSIPSDIQSAAGAFSESGKTPLFFARKDRLLGVIAVADVIKEDSPRAVREMQNMGIRVIMLTGDNEKTARAIAAEAGVDEVIASVMPDGKEAVIRALLEEGKVAMVGDGINDAPALTRADIGIAIGAGTDIAIDAADVVLMKSRLSDVPAAIRLSRATLTNIRQNLFWAFFYNVIGIPLAAGLFIHAFGWQLNPMFGAAAMSLSSFCVVSNALRLNLVNIRRSDRDRKIRQNKIKQIRKEDTVMEKTLKIDGMMCPHCEARVKKTLEELPQVESALVSHESGTAVLTLKEDISDAKLKEIIEGAGYKVI